MENFHYTCLYDVLKYLLQHAERQEAINRLKAKIVQRHSAKQARGQVDLKTQDILQEEQMSLIQLITWRQRRKQRDIQAVHEQDHQKQTSAIYIVRVFSHYIRRKYDPIQVDEECMRKWYKKYMDICLMIVETH